MIEKHLLAEEAFEDFCFKMGKITYKILIVSFLEHTVN